MADYQAASDAIKRMAQQYQQLMDVAGVLDQIGSLDNAANEAKSAQTKAQADLAASKAALDAANAGLAAVKQQGDDLLAKAQADADAQVRAAQDQIDKLVARATNDAATIMAKATADGEATAQAISDKIAGQRLMLAAVDQSVGEAQKDLDDLIAQSTAAEKRLAAAQAQIQKLLGA